jgi:hypothetical protein
MVFKGRSPRNSIIPHKGYNPYTLENHSTADLYYDATNQTVGSVSTILYYAARVYALIHPSMRLLEYMGFVLVVFPLKCGFIIVQSVLEPA